MKRFLKITAIILAVLCINSISPLVWFYIQKETPQPTNEEAAAKLKDNAGEHFSFIVFGDNHGGFPLNDSATLKLIRLMNREDRFKGKTSIDFAVNLGDATFYRGREANYRDYNKLRSLIKWPVITVMGNHDYVNGGWRHFQKYIGKHEFSFTDRNSYFIILDNKITDVTEKQFVWLDAELQKAASYKHRFLFMHKSPISLYYQSWFRPENNKWAHRLMKLCEKHNVDIVFAGHEHMFAERLFGKVRYVISGAAGMPVLFPESDGGYLHYVVVRVYGDYVDYEVRKVFPPFWEYIGYYLWKEIFYGLKFVFFKDGLLF
ncbi:MAG TPA: metallophosphoesterase [Candidatus Omnitrophota bacterium]|nr:metallophosphoesterase [Candidatus Omnitrophota bacterium]